MDSKGAAEMKTVYVMHSPVGIVKIGMSKDAGKRRDVMQKATGLGLKLVHTTETMYARAVEAAAHQLLSEQRKAGEWFDVSIETAVSAVERAVAEVDERKRLGLLDQNRGQASVVALRIPEDLKEWARKQAQTENRSLGNWVVKLIQDKRAKVAQESHRNKR